MPLKHRPMRFGVKVAQIKKVAFFKMNYNVQKRRDMVCTTIKKFLKLETETMDENVWR